MIFNTQFQLTLQPEVCNDSGFAFRIASMAEKLDVGGTLQCGAVGVGVLKVYADMQFFVSLGHDPGANWFS